MRIYMKKKGTGAPTYSISADAVTIAEGDDITLTLNTTSVKDGTQFDLIFSGANINNSDFTDGLLTNTVTVTNNQAILTKTIASSLADLNPETFTVQARKVSGELVAETVGITILGETFGITANAYSISEGSSVTFTVSAPNTGDGTALNLQFSGTGITASDFQDNTLTNQVIVNNGTASLVKNITLDAITEATENLTVQVKNPSNGWVLATISTNVSILNVIDSGEAVFTTTGSRTWTCPAGITSVSVVAIGGGGGGAQAGKSARGGSGGGLGWRNNISVIPGQQYTVYVGAGGARGTQVGQNGSNGTFSYFMNISTVRANGGTGGILSGTTNWTNGGAFVGDGGGVGGRVGYVGSDEHGSGGGGAAGYSGNGGDGGYNNAGSGSAGAGGGGGGGGNCGSGGASGCGGGVGIYGQGANGSGGIGSSENGTSGTGGSGGANGSIIANSSIDSQGGNYGGGGGGAKNNLNENGRGGQGAVRIIWGPGRSFPSTNVTQTYSKGNIFSY